MAFPDIFDRDSSFRVSTKGGLSQSLESVLRSWVREHNTLESKSSPCSVASCSSRFEGVQKCIMTFCVPCTVIQTDAVSLKSSNRTMLQLSGALSPKPDILMVS